MRSDRPNLETLGDSPPLPPHCPPPPRDVRPRVETFSGGRGAAGIQRVEAWTLLDTLQCRAQRPTEMDVGPMSVAPRRTDLLPGTVRVSRCIYNLRTLVAVEMGAADRGIPKPGSRRGFTMRCLPFVVVAIYVNWGIERCCDAEVYGIQATSVGESTAFTSAEKATG